MNFKNIIFLAAILHIVTLISCEGGTTFTKNIENNSNDTLSVKLYFNYMDSENISILPKQTKEVYYYDVQGLFVDEGYYCSSELDSATITTKSNKSLTKDIMNSDNWTHDSSDGRNSTENCLFIINDIDLQ